MLTEFSPVGAGYVRVPNPRQYALPQSESVQTDGTYTEMFQASVVHQLHCMVGPSLNLSRHTDYNFKGSAEKLHACL